MTGIAPAKGDLRVWHIARLPGDPFHVSVASVAIARLVIEVLISYDSFQLANRIRPEYFNLSGLEIFNPELDPTGDFGGWLQWTDSHGNTIDESDE